jgi:hypothetical protein
MSDTVDPKIAAALLAAQKDIESATKNAKNPHFGNDYADLATVIDAVKPALNKHDIAFVQLPVEPPFEGHLAIRTILLHKSGETLAGTAVVPLPKSDPQGYGSAVTYARRYALASIVGLKTLDDDGEAASGRPKASASKKSFTRPEEKPEEKPLKGLRNLKLTPKKSEKKGTSKLFPVPQGGK